MKHYNLVVLANPVPGRDVEFNDWYDNVHIGDILAVPGFVAAKRYKLVSDQKPHAPEVEWRYLAIYDMETDDPIAALAEVRRRDGTDQMVISDAIDRSRTYARIYEATAGER